MNKTNDGIVLLNHTPLADQESTAFCVLGLPRGGTTMTARLLQAAGIHMGENLGFNAEDPEFAGLLKEQNPDTHRFHDLVARRHASHRLWGFKAPFRYHWDLLAQINNVRYVTVFRDPLVVAQGNVIATGVDEAKSLKANLTLQRRILDFVLSTERPHLLYSYEKALMQPANISRAILLFAGAPDTARMVSELSAIVRPNDPAYVDARAKR